jgi:hypothetical protein
MSVLCLLLVITKYNGTINAVLRNDLGILLIITVIIIIVVIIVITFTTSTTIIINNIMVA